MRSRSLSSFVARVLVVAAAVIVLTSRDANAGTHAVCASCPAGGPTFVNGNDSNIQYPEVIPIFWDDGTGTHPWSTANPSEPQVLAQILAEVNSQWSASITQYGRRNGATGWIGRFRMAPYGIQWTGPSPDPSCATFATFNSNPTQQQSYLDDIIHWVSQGKTGTFCANKGGCPAGGCTATSGPVPPILGGNDMLYSVLLPNGADGGGGYNLTDSFNSVNFDQLKVTADGGFGPTMSHEMAEAAAVGWQGNFICGVGPGDSYQNCTPSNSCSVNGGYAHQGWGISDICECFTETQNSVNLASYYSAIDNECVVPETWQGFQVNTLNGSGWTQPSNGPAYLRQMYGGGKGVLATDGSDNAWFYSSSGGWGGGAITANGSYVQGSMLALGGGGAGGDVILAWIGIGQTAGNLYRYDLTSATYTALPALPTQSTWVPSQLYATGVYVTGGGYVLVTDTHGRVWLYDYAGSWVILPSDPDGNAFDQVIANNTDIVGLDIGRHHVWDFSDTNLYTLYNNGTCSGCSWTQPQYFGGSDWYEPQLLIGNPDAAYFAALNGGSFYADYGTTSEDNVNGNGGEYAPTTAHNSFGTTDRFQWLAPSNSATWATTFAKFNGHTTWSTNNGTAGRLIGGNELYATKCTSGAPNCVNY